MPENTSRHTSKHLRLHNLSQFHLQNRRELSAKSKWNTTFLLPPSQYSVLDQVRISSLHQCFIKSLHNPLKECTKLVCHHWSKLQMWKRLYILKIYFFHIVRNLKDAQRKTKPLVCSCLHVQHPNLYIKPIPLKWTIEFTPSLAINGASKE